MVVELQRWDETNKQEVMERKQFCLQRAFRNVWRLLFALIGDREQCIIYYTEAKEAASYFTKHSSFPPTANTNNRCNLCQGWKTLVVSSVTVVWRVCVKFVGTKLMNIKPGQSRSQKPWEKRLKTEGYQQWRMVQRGWSWEQRESAARRVFSAGGDRDPSFMWLSFRKLGG